MNTFEWNNRAVRHLRRGNSSDAVLILLKTVFRLRKVRAREGILSLHSSNDEPAPLEEQHEDLTEFVSDLPLSAWPKRTSPQTIPLFDHAFEFSSRSHQPPYNEDSHLWQLTYAILLYNTALALHLKGLENHHDASKEAHPSSASQTLHLAIKFYKMALEVVDKQKKNMMKRVGTQAAGGRLELLLHLAILNNLGNLHCSLYNVKEALQCVEWLKIHLSKTTTTTNNNNNNNSTKTKTQWRNVPSLLPHHHSFFSFSALTKSELSLAPAA